MATYEDIKQGYILAVSELTEIYRRQNAHRSNQPLLNGLAPLAKAGVPLLHLCGSLDPGLNDQTRVLEKKYQELGGQITVIVKEGEGHFLTAPKDLKPVVDFITTRLQ